MLQFFWERSLTTAVQCVGSFCPLGLETATQLVFPKADCRSSTFILFFAALFHPFFVRTTRKPPALHDSSMRKQNRCIAALTAVEVLPSKSYGLSAFAILVRHLQEFCGEQGAWDGDARVAQVRRAISRRAPDPMTFCDVPCTSLWPVLNEEQSLSVWLECHLQDSGDGRPSVSIFRAVSSFETDDTQTFCNSNCLHYLGSSCCDNETFLMQFGKLPNIHDLHHAVSFSAISNLPATLQMARLKISPFAKYDVDQEFTLVDIQSNDSNVEFGSMYFFWNYSLRLNPKANLNQFTLQTILIQY